MNQPFDERAAELRDLFFLGAQEHLQALNESGLRLEAAPRDAEILREVRRIIHTLKGDSAVAGLHDVSELAHELEDVLTPEMADGDGRALAEVVLAAADMFDAILTAHRAQVEPPSGDPLRSLIWKLAQQAKPEDVRFATRFAPQFQWSEYEQLEIAAARQSGKTVFHVGIAISPECPMPVACRELVRKMLHEIGTVLALREDDNANSQTIEAALSCSHTREWLLERCRIPNVVSEAIVTEALEEKSAGTSAGETIRRPTLRVDAAKLDAAMDLAGELILGRSMLQQAVNEFSRRFPKDPLRTRLTEALSFQTQVLNQLQRSLLELRMVPMEQLFRRFPRQVRDLARQCGKSVRLNVEGGDTSLDKGILESLSEPLMHLVRNAVDHGIESAQQRAAAGKAAEAVIGLAARYEGSQVVLEVRDDGRGMDPRIILAKAVERGLISATAAAQLSPADAFKFIFEPGFSTAAEITEISGRGVGMDAVKAAIERLKGSVEVQTEPGRGTIVRLRVPLTLAMTRAMLFHAGPSLYAVPVDCLQDIVRLGDDNLETAAGREVLRLRDQVLPIVRVHASTSARAFAMVVSVAGRKYALAVDKIIGEEQLVLKTLDDQFASSEMVSGASVMGDGRVVLVLNIASVVERGMLPSAPPVSVKPASSSGLGATA